MPLFDSYLVVDWSASSVPKVGSDSIWSAFSSGGSGPDVVNHPTRFEFEAWLRDVVGGSGRLLAGFDFSFGYPAGFASRLAADGTPSWSAVWSALAERINDAPDNANNRFEVAAGLNALVSAGPGPFWGCPPSRVTPALSSGKAPGFPHGDIEEFRLAERIMRTEGRWISSSWQLLGAGSVGSQMLVGIPVLERLRREPPEGVEVDVWPFTTGLVAPRLAAGRTHVVLVEVWPSTVRPDPDAHPVKDARQVITLCEHFSRLDRADALTQSFEPAVGVEVREVVVDEEGWILGVGSHA